LDLRTLLPEAALLRPGRGPSGPGAVRFVDRNGPRFAEVQEENALNFSGSQPVLKQQRVEEDQMMKKVAAYALMAAFLVVALVTGDDKS
jgi:hypothetical protein